MKRIVRTAMRSGALVVAPLLVGCASTPAPRGEKVASARLAITSAETAGADDVPQARTHLEAARRDLEVGTGRAGGGDQHDATDLVARAEADARLAAALAHEAAANASARRELATASSLGAATPRQSAIGGGPPSEPALEPQPRQVAGTGKPPPRELVDARAAYARARSGPAVQHAPAALEGADAALEVAEQAYATSATWPNPRTLAYVAERKAQIADAEARELIAQERATDADRAVRQLRRERTGVSAPDLPDEAGTTEILFPIGRSELVPSAETQLGGVMDAFRGEPNQIVVIECAASHASTESAELADRRADSIEDYLESHGIDAARVVTRCFGDSQPIASNEPSRDRADNGRVRVTIRPGFGR